MSLCAVLIGHNGSVTKVRNVGKKNLCIEANLKPVSGPCWKWRGFTPSRPLCGSLGLSPTLSELLLVQQTCQAVSTFRASFVMLSGLILCELLNKKNPPLQWKCSLTKWVLFTRSRGLANRGDITVGLSSRESCPPPSLPFPAPPPNWLSISPIALAAPSLVIFSAAVQSQMLSFPVVRQKIGHCLFIFNVQPAVYMQIYQSVTN